MGSTTRLVLSPACLRRGYVVLKLSEAWMSYAEFLRAAVDAKEPEESKPAKKKHVREGIHLDGQIDLGERIVACLNCEIGSENAAELLEHIAKKMQALSPVASI